MEFKHGATDEIVGHVAEERSHAAQLHNYIINLFFFSPPLRVVHVNFHELQMHCVVRSKYAGFHSHFDNCRRRRWAHHRDEGGTLRAAATQDDSTRAMNHLIECNTK